MYVTSPLVEGYLNCLYVRDLTIGGVANSWEIFSWWSLLVSCKSWMCCCISHMVAMSSSRESSKEVSSFSSCLLAEAWSLFFPCRSIIRLSSRSCASRLSVSGLLGETGSTGDIAAKGGSVAGGGVSSAVAEATGGDCGGGGGGAARMEGGLVTSIGSIPSSSSCNL